MTRQRSFKRLVRARMEMTGERYAAARAALLAASEPTLTDAPTLTVSDEVIRRRTGRGWEEWFDLLDDWGAIAKPHREIARWLQSEHAVDGWSSQSITVSYERARGRRAVGETANGFTVSAQKTVAVPVERLYEAFADPSLRAQWLPDAELRERALAKPKSARFDWGDGESRVVAWLEPKGDAKSTASIQHERLPDGRQAERMKAYWRERVAHLKEVLER
jgi:hypothetical protein